MKGKIKIGDLLIDDVDLVYEVVEVFKNSVALQPVPNKAELACDIMTYTSMENEGWKIYRKSSN